MARSARRRQARRFLPRVKSLRPDCLGQEKAEGSVTPAELSESYSHAGFGAHFVEVAVHRDTGEVRVRRMLGVFAAGRILNPKTARSQMIGGMIWGIGSALMEKNIIDQRYGSFVNQDLASYHVPVNADIGEMDVVFLHEDDPHGNPLGTKGIGELGICGAGAAVINAIHKCDRRTDPRLARHPRQTAVCARGARSLAEFSPLEEKAQENQWAHPNFPLHGSGHWRRRIWPPAVIRVEVAEVGRTTEASRAVFGRHSIRCGASG